MSIKNDLLLKLFKTPAIVEQIRKNLVSRDISIIIDNKEYQITKKRLDEDELTKLKAEVWDLRSALNRIIMNIESGATHNSLLSLIKKEKDLLK